MADSAGIVQNSVIDRGDGYAVAITNIAGNNLTLSSPLVQNIIGDITNYTGLAGVNYSPAGQLATFDISRVGGNYSVVIAASGENYVVGDAIVVPGTSLGGSTPANDATVLVESVDTGGEILTASISGSAFTGTGSTTGTSPTWQGGLGQGAQINVTKTNQSYTVALNSPTYTNTAVGTFPGAAGSSATFDVTATAGSYSASVNGAGTGYIVNDVIRIDGSTFGGTSANHANIRVTAVTGGGAIQTISVLGTAPAQEVTYNTVAFTGGNGTSAAFNVTRNGTTYSAAITSLGSNYQQNDVLTFLGSNLGGIDSTNDAQLTVTAVDGNGGILTFNVTGTAVDTKSYTAISSGANLSGVDATFDVSISGTTYSVSVNQAGNDYSVGQELLIAGSSLGGTSPANDLTVTVASITGSTGAGPINTISTSGTAALEGTSGYKIGDQFLVGGGDLGGAATTNDAIVSVGGVNGTGGITSLTIGGTGTDANVDYTSPTYTTSASGTGAVFDINRTGTTYSATFSNNGSSFVGAETIDIAGTELGGTSPANDCQITVDTVSAGAVATFTVTGTAVNTQTYTNVNKAGRTGTGLSVDVTLSSGSYSVALNNPGANYAVNQTFKILGTNLFGTSPANDLEFTITAVNNLVGGVVTTIGSITGTANTGTGNSLNVSGTNRTPQGVGAQFSITRSNQTDSSTAYTDVQITSLGSNYAVGDKLVIAGTSLGGQTPANDVTIRIQSVNTTGGVLAQTHTGTAVAGTGLSVFGSLSISETITQNIAQNSTITYSALATMQVDSTPWTGSGNAFIVVIHPDDGGKQYT